MIAVGGGSVITTATVLLVRAARRGVATPAVAVAHRWLAAGAAVTTGTIVVGLAVLAALGADWSDHHGQRMRLASLVALGLAAGDAALWIGLLRLPCVIRGAAAATRLALDGLIVAAALWFIGW